MSKNSNIKSFADAISPEELRQKGEVLMQMVASIKSLQEELAKKKLEIAPYVINQPLELANGTISYVKSSEGLTLSRRNLKSVLMQRLKISETAAEALLASASNKKVVDAYIKILLKRAKVPQIKATTPAEPVKMSDINKMFNQFRHTLLSLNSIVDEFNVYQRQPRMAQDDKLIPKYEKIRDDILRDIREHAKSLPTFGRISANYQNYAEKMKELYTKLNTINSIIDDLKVGKNIDKKRMDSASEFLAESKVDDAGIVIKPETMVSATDTKNSDGYKAFADGLSELRTKTNKELLELKRKFENIYTADEYQKAYNQGIVNLIDKELLNPDREARLKEEKRQLQEMEEIGKYYQRQENAEKAKEAIKSKETAGVEAGKQAKEEAEFNNFLYNTEEGKPISAYLTFAETELAKRKQDAISKAQSDHKYKAIETELKDLNADLKSEASAKKQFLDPNNANYLKKETDRKAMQSILDSKQSVINDKNSKLKEIEDTYKSAENIQKLESTIANFKKDWTNPANQKAIQVASPEGAKRMLKEEEDPSINKVVASYKKKLDDPKTLINEKLSILFSQDLERNTKGMLPTEDYLTKIIKDELKGFPPSYQAELASKGLQVMGNAQRGIKDNTAVNMFMNKIQNIGKIHNEIKNNPEIKSLSPTAQSVIAEKILRNPDINKNDIVNEVKSKITKDGKVDSGKLSNYEKQLETQKKIHNKQDEIEIHKAASESIILPQHERDSHKSAMTKAENEMKDLRDEQSGMKKLRPIIQAKESFDNIINAKKNELSELKNKKGTPTTSEQKAKTELAKQINALENSKEYAEVNRNYNEKIPKAIENNPELRDREELAGYMELKQAKFEGDIERRLRSEEGLAKAKKEQLAKKQEDIDFFRNIANKQLDKLKEKLTDKDIVNLLGANPEATIQSAKNVSDLNNVIASMSKLQKGITDIPRPDIEPETKIAGTPEGFKGQLEKREKEIARLEAMPKYDPLTEELESDKLTKQYLAKYGAQSLTPDTIEKQQKMIESAIDNIANLYNVDKGNADGWKSAALSALQHSGEQSASGVIKSFEMSAKQRKAERDAFEEQEKAKAASTQEEQKKETSSYNVPNATYTEYGKQQPSEMDEVQYNVPPPANMYYNQSSSNELAANDAESRMNGLSGQMGDSTTKSDAILALNSQISFATKGLDMAKSELSRVKSMGVDDKTIAVFSSKVDKISNTIQTLVEKKSKML